MPGGSLAPSITYPIGEVHNKPFVLDLAKRAVLTRVRKSFYTVFTLQGLNERIEDGEVIDFGIVTLRIDEVAPTGRLEEFRMLGVDPLNRGLIQAVYNFPADEGTAKLLM